jgi:hypothetical protein
VARSFGCVCDWRIRPPLCFSGIQTLKRQPKHFSADTNPKRKRAGPQSDKRRTAASG